MSHDSQETRQMDSKDLPRSIRPGDILQNRYRIEEELGRGGMGVVFRASDTHLERSVAVKVLPEVGASEELRDRLFREARAAAGLNHPHVIAVHDVGEDQGLPFFVMELLPGKTLADRRVDDMPEVVRLASQICSALDHAHGHDIVHRDLKPENVMIAGDGSLKLGDLGLAFPTRRSRITQAGRIVGTATYMAPEQALGQTVDGRADLYSLGVILYELVTGNPPFTGRDPLAVVSQHIHAPVVPPRAVRSTVPPGLERVILRLLAKNPDKRYATAREVQAALEEALSDPTPSPGDSGEGMAAVALLDALSRGKLVGRQEELAEAREFWRRALGGHGHCVLLSGEPGAGKTRLGKELLVQAALDGATVLTGACFEFEATTPYLPFADAFRRWVHGLGDNDALREILGESAAQMAKFAPEIESRLGPFPPRPTLPPQEERSLFFDAVVSAFQSLSRERGLVFYIDDLHWADSATLWLLGRLLRHIRDESVLVVGSYRETELDRAHPLGKALVDWNRERLVTRIMLRRFTLEETRAQLETLLGDAVSEDFAEAVHRETEGNPFFVEEVLKALIEDGRFKRKSGGWEKPKTLELTLPQSVMEAIGSRLDRVSPECNEVLRTAAVVGKTFRFEELLAASGGQAEDPLLDALDEAVAAQVLTAEADESFAFTHDKIREVLYKELNPIRRRRLHRRTAQGLEAFGGGVKVETLAHHYIEAGDFEQGLKFARQAGREAEQLYAYEEALAAYTRARDCAEALDRPQEQAELEEAMGLAHSSFGQPRESAGHYEAAVKLAQDPMYRNHLKCQAAANYVTNGDPKGLDLAREVIADPASKEDVFLAAQAMGIEARYCHLEGKSRQAAELLEEAARLIGEYDPAALSRSQVLVLTNLHSHLSGAYQHLARYDNSNFWARKNIALGEATGDLIAQAFGYEFLGENAAGQYEWEKMIEYAQAEREIAKEANARDRHAWTCLVLSLAYQGLGRSEEAEAVAREGVELSGALGELRLEGLMLLYLVDILSAQGRLEEAGKAMEVARQAVEKLDLVYHRAEVERMSMRLERALGNPEAALRHAEAVRELARGIDSVVSRLWAGPEHVELLIELGRREEAKATLQSYAEMVAQCQTPNFEKEIERLRSLLEG